MKVKVFNKVVSCRALPDSKISLHFDTTIDLYILFNDQKTFEFVSEPTEADIIPVEMNDTCWQGLEVNPNWFKECAKYFNKKQIAVNLRLILHVDEFVMWRQEVQRYNTGFEGDASPFKKVINLHTDTTLRDDPTKYDNFVYTDFLFNRSHTMHFNNELVKAKWNDITAKNHWWHHPTDYTPRSKFPSSVYELTPDDAILARLHMFEKWIEGNDEIDKKIFVAPNLSRRLSGDQLRSKPRQILNTLLHEYQGYIGDISQGTALLSNRDTYNDFDVLGVNGWGFSPPHNDYYDTSAISIYVETLIYHEEHMTTCITEKTFTPMCKGHFVLPFGTPGIIDHLKLEYGFEFPEWLDYKYDNLLSIKDDSGIINSPRWASYLSTVKSVCELGAEKLCLLKAEEIETLLHNRSVMRDNGQKHGLHDPQVLQEIMT